MNSRHIPFSLIAIAVIFGTSQYSARGGASVNWHSRNSPNFPVGFHYWLQQGLFLMIILTFKTKELPSFSSCYCFIGGISWFSTSWWKYFVRHLTVHQKTSLVGCFKRLVHPRSNCFPLMIKWWYVVTGRIINPHYEFPFDLLAHILCLSWGTLAIMGLWFGWTSFLGAVANIAWKMWARE